MLGLFVFFGQVFSTVVVFGLFHGLAFLPVLLSIVGPAAYLHADNLAKSHAMAVRIDVRPAETVCQEIPDNVRTNGEPNHVEVGPFFSFFFFFFFLLFLKLSFSFLLFKK